MSLIHLIYVSTAIKDQTDAELDAILECAVRRNKENNLTGMLLCAGRSFLQVIEGEEKDIDETFIRIEKDSRHDGIIILDHEIIPFRNFEKWNMGFHRISKKDAIEKPGFAPFFEKGFDVSKMGIKPSVGLEILLSFADNYDNSKLS